MEYSTESLILREVTENDLAEVVRTWPSDHPLSSTEAQAQIARMRDTHTKNTAGKLLHLCLAVCAQADPGTIRGWCGLDGSRNPSGPEIFVLLDESFRNRGYGTQCMKELLRIAADEYRLRAVHGGCFKDNIASARAMVKAGMVPCGTEANGDPRFEFVPAGK